MQANLHAKLVPTPEETFSSGAKRSERRLRYDLIPTGPLRRLAVRYTDGAAKYGDYNWCKGLRDREYVQQFYDHLYEHVLRFKENLNTKDDNLAAIAWGAFALMEAERVSPETVLSAMRDRDK